MTLVRKARAIPASKCVCVCGGGGQCWVRRSQWPVSAVQCTGRPSGRYIGPAAAGALCNSLRLGCCGLA